MSERLIALRNRSGLTEGCIADRLFITISLFVRHAEYLRGM